MKVILMILFFVVSCDAQAAKAKGKPVRRGPQKKIIVVPQNEKIDFEGLSLEGEVKTPGEFYFKARDAEKFDDLSKRKPNFRREMLRDAVISQ